MRIRGRLDLHQEDGAILAIVALLMTAIFGMVALTVDVGGLLSLRRQMVTAADSAALAVAQSCATADATEASLASTRADEYATQNVSNAARTEFAIGPNGGECGTSLSGRVTVGYESPKGLIFAPILGFPSETDVSARATAVWGAAAAANPIPVMVSEDWLAAECSLQELDIGDAMECLWDDDVIAAASWGWLDLDDWNASKSSICTGAGGAAKQKSWLRQGGISEQLAVNESPPTWVCATPGLRADNVHTLDAYAKANPDNILYLPISRPPPLMKNSHLIDKYNIVGFLAVRVIEADKVSPSSIQGECEARYVGPVHTNQAMFLDDLVETCTDPYEAPFSSIQILQVRELDAQGEPRPGNENTWTFSGTDDRAFTWTGDELDDGLHIKFKFVRPGAANCGTQTTSNMSAFCIHFHWMGLQLGPGGVIECIGACVGNVRAIQLTE